MVSDGKLKKLLMLPQQIYPLQQQTYAAKYYANHSH